MAFIRTAVQFFKTWFLPLPAHDDEGGTVTPLHTSPEPPAKPALSTSTASTPETAPESGVAAAASVSPFASDASYAVPPVPAAAPPTEEPAPAASPDTDKTTEQLPAQDYERSASTAATSAAASTGPDFSHLVRSPEAADQRYSRRRMEGTDPAAFE